MPFHASQNVAHVVIEKVEPAHLEGTVVRAIARADATIVGHHVQAILAVDGGIHRADGFTRRILAVLAHHRLRNHLRFRIVLVHAREIAVRANPVHLTAIDDLLLANDRNIILRLTGDHACRTTGADVKIHHHAPLMNVIERRMRVERDVRRDMGIHAHRLREMGIGLVFLQLRLTRQVSAAPFERPMLLRERQFVILASDPDFRTKGKIRFRTRAQRVGVKPAPPARHGRRRAAGH